MDPETTGGINRGDGCDIRTVSLSGIEEKIKMPDFFREGVKNVAIEGFSVFEKNEESILKSTIFGIPLYAIGVFGIVLWLIKRK